MRLYKKFLDGVPEYLARYYWWVYLWRWSIWFFDHQPIINAILFGQYDKLLKITLAQIENNPGSRTLQLTCVYGKLTPELFASTNHEVHLCDAATGQLQLARRKTLLVANRNSGSSSHQCTVASRLPDKTTSHSTKQPKYGCQVAGYHPILPPVGEGARTPSPQSSPASWRGSEREDQFLNSESLRELDITRCHLARMNAESLGYRNDAFDQVIVFFLFHEMPDYARHNTYGEIARVVRPGGSVLITEYAEMPQHHWLYRFMPFRLILGHLEPFLPGFWQEDVNAKLSEALQQQGKALSGEPSVEYCFDRFYRVMRIDIKCE